MGNQKLPQKIGQHLYVYVPYSIDRNKHRPKFITFADIFYVYSFWHIFNALRLFYLPNFPVPTFIPCPMSILDCRVCVSVCLLGI